MDLRTWLAFLALSLCCLTGCQKTASEVPVPGETLQNMQEVEAKSPVSEAQGSFQVVEPGSLYTGTIEIRFRRHPEQLCTKGMASQSMQAIRRTGILW